MITHHLPAFPEFRAFDIADSHWYERFYAQFEPYSDFEFNNLLMWLNSNKDLAYSNLNGNVVFCYSDPFGGTNKSLYSLLGNTDLPESVSVLLDWLESHGNEAVLSMIPEEVCAKLDHDVFDIAEDIDNNDYILDARKTAYLVGSDLRSLREDCNSFMRKYSSEVIIKDFGVTEENYLHLVNNMHTWDQVYTKTGNDADRHESVALNNLFSYIQHLEYNCVSVYIDGILEGFVLYHYPPQVNYVMATAVKISYRYQDLYDFCVFAFANRALRPGVEFINFEQDLGIPGLRNYKRSLKPVKYLCRYTVSKRA